MYVQNTPKQKLRSVQVFCIPPSATVSEASLIMKELYSRRFHIYINTLPCFSSIFWK